MSKKLSFSIAVNLLVENFKKGTNTVKDSLRSMQMQALTFAAALGAGGLGLSGLLTRFKDVARETSRVITALKNVSNGTKGFADNLRFVNDMANKYGLEVNALTGNFAKFTASATQANMPMEQQKKVFESLSKASTVFGLSAEDANGVFLALSQMMGKGKISSEELRKQMGERIPIAMQAMAKAAGVSMAGLEKLLKQGKLMSSEIIPKFADALNEMIPNVDTDNLEASLNRLSNAFRDIVDSSGFQNKYKALIDGLTSLLQAASKNVQNIIVGIVAAIGFVVTNGLAKVYRGYEATGRQIIANATITHNKLRVAVAARVEAEKSLEELKLQHAQATASKQIALVAKIEKQKQLLTARTAQVNAAYENAKAAAAQAAAIKSMGAWATAWATISGSAKKLMTSIKAMWNTFAPAIIVSAIIALVGHFKNMHDEAKRVKNIFSDYRKELDKIKPGNEAIQLEKLRDIATDINRSLKERQSALDQVNKLLNTNFTIDSKSLEANGDINSQIERRIALLKAQAKAEYLTTKLVDMEAKRDELEEKRDRLTREERSSNVKGKALIRSFLGNDIAGLLGFDTSKKMQAEIDQINKVIWDANRELERAIIDGGINNEITKTTTTTTGSEPDNKALRAAEKRLEALRKLDEEDRKRQIEKSKFDLDMQQKAINLLDDSFEKRIKQTSLNLKKEKLEIEEYQNDLLKQQSDYAKTKYISVHGNDTGFDAYFKQLQDNDFKDNNGVSILPEGLRPEDIKKQVGELLSAAQAAQKKGLADINKDLSLMLREQELMFASDLEQKLAELDNYYNEQLIKAAGNAELIAQIEDNRKSEKLEAATDDKIQKLDFSEQLENERAAGLESIGMTELVEEKKLEITKKYLRLRIDALQELANAGNEDAKNQIKLYQEALNKLDAAKPAKSLKALADKAIFDRIKKGFEKAGDSADKAEEKTTSLLSSISQKAGLVANITSELQSMFGGLDEGLDEALSAVGNIAQGFASGGIAGGAMAVIGEGMKLFNKASEAAVRHQEALKEVEAARLASQRAYNLLLLEQNLLLEEAVSLFGEKQITRAANAVWNYHESLRQLQGEMQDDKLAGASVLTGHKKTGLFGWGKGKDIYSSILDEYDDIIDKEGNLNKARIQNILDTRTMSEETRNYLQNLLDLSDSAEAAQEELNNYLQSTFGALGDDIMTSLENAIKDKGVDAWESFGDAGAKVIEQLGRQIAYELFFADKFKELQSQLKAIYESGKSPEEISSEAADLIGKFYQGIGPTMELAQGFMENMKEEAKKYGFDLWNDGNGTSQTASSGSSQSMDQDTGDRLDGRFAALQMSGLRMEGFLSTLTISSKNIFNMTISINDELQKHTNLFNEIKKIQLNSFYEIEGTKDVLENISGVLEKIDKNTSKL
ncbi:MAG: tape measure protein [Dysgonamonadaceae bacterium]|jgi:tape measure domain-containing protein|nr:tape measure protein [Dysgonamonadaceae bacterium]